MQQANYKKPEDGAYIKGLYLEGASWDTDKHCIAESHPRELYVEMPYIHISPKPKDEVPVVEGIPEQRTAG